MVMSAEVWITVFLLVLVLNTNATDARQSFSRQPANTTVRLGTTALIRCAVQNLRTSVQWTKNGFGLGMKRFPNPRYSISGNTQLGEYNLRIQDVQLSDDGVFRCQALPDHRRNINDLNSRPAFLTVIVPPKNVNLDPSVSGVISVRYPGKAMISCSTPCTKPESEISWRVGGVVYDGQVNEKFESKPGSKLITTTSSIELNPDKQNNGSVIECIIKHPAMDASFSSKAVLNVLYPPNPPSITDYNGQPIKIGEILTVKCIAHGGNPLAKITWLIDDLIVSRDYTHSKDTANSVLHHKVRPEDHGKVVECRAESPALDGPLVTQVVLEVYYPPANLFLEQYPKDGAQAQESLSFICHYEHSNPKATLKWYIDDVELPTQWNYNFITTPYIITILKSDATSFSTNLTLTSLRREDANKEIKCLASLPIIGYEGKVSTYPTVNYPPHDVDISIFYLNTPITVPTSNHGVVDPPMRSLLPNRDSTLGGLNDNTAFRAGDTIQLRCLAKGGNPPPQLRWMQGGVPIIPGPKTTISSPEISTEIKTSSEGREIKEFLTSVTLELTLDAEYNGRFITCEAGHELYSDTLESREKLKVVFPPASLEIDQFPTHPVAGHSMSLTCTTSSSNPPSRISWYLQGRKLPEQWSVELPPSRGNSQGFVTSSRLRMIPEVEEDGSEIVCSAEIEILQATIRQPMKLSVRYPPVITRINDDNAVNVTEDALGIDIEAIAHGNPSNITYAWYRLVEDADAANLQETDRVPLLADTDRVIWSTVSGNLRINDPRRSDDGVYIVKATNGRGATEMNVTLNVFYSPVITKISGPEYDLKEGDTTTLRCDFDSHKLTPARVNWIKLLPGNGRKYYEVSTNSDHSVLTLRNITAEDRGNYKCRVYNGIGQRADSQMFSIELIYAPIFLASSPRKIAVSSVASDGTLSPPAVLPCTAIANPVANFKWMVGNETVSKSGEFGYSFLSDVLNFETNRNSLRVTTIHDMQRGKDGTVAEFTCITYNKAGESKRNIKIVLRGPPDSPTDLQIFNITDRSFDISWGPGFDGGSDQTFLLRIKPNGIQTYTEIKTSSNHVTVSGLKARHVYEVELLARNMYGKSDTTTPLQTRTADSPTRETKRFPTGFVLPRKSIILISTVGGLILVLLFILPLLCRKYCNCRSSSYKPGAINNDTESSKRAESTLSSHLSASQRESLELNEMEKLSDTTCSGRQSDRDCHSSECCQGSDKNTIITELGLLPQSNCFDYALSRCSSSITTEPYEDGRQKSATCSCAAFQDDIPNMPTYSQINRFHELNRSNRNGKPFGQQRPSRDACQEPLFRCDVRPSPSDSFSNNCVAYANDLYEREGFMQRPDNLPLPPALPLFNHLQYPTQQASMLMNSDTSGTASLGFTRTQGMRSSFRPYHTLDAGPCKPNLDRFPSDEYFPRDSYQNRHTTDRSQNAYEDYSELQHHPGRMSSQESTSSNPGDRYLYNIVSIPSYQNYTDSYSLDKCSGSSPLFVKSIDNIDDAQQPEKSIVNEDGTINTYGHDEATESESKISKSNIICSVRESRSQDPLPSCSPPSFSNNSESTDTKTTMPSAETQSYSNFGRRSLRGVSSTAIEKFPRKRDLTPPLCFRDELHLALVNTTRQQQPQLSNEETHQVVSSYGQHTSRCSYDDQDSGCGGSNDAVPIELASPVVETFRLITESQTGNEEMEGALFV